MTTPHERTRAMVWAGGFLIELARDRSVPLKVRQKAVIIARHFPTIEQVSAMAMLYPSSGVGVELEDVRENPSWAEQCPYGPLTYSTRLRFPEN